MSDGTPKLIRLGAPLIRTKLSMKPCRPVEGPIAKGPLVKLAAPLHRVKLNFRSVSQPALDLKFSVAERTTEAVLLAKLTPILELVKGCGFSWDRSSATGEPGRIAIQFVPTTEEAVERLPWLKETLTPVLADIREVSKPEWSDVPASKV